MFFGLFLQNRWPLLLLALAYSSCLGITTPCRGQNTFAPPSIEYAPPTTGTATPSSFSPTPPAQNNFFSPTQPELYLAPELEKKPSASSLPEFTLGRDPTSPPSGNPSGSLERPGTIVGEEIAPDGMQFADGEALWYAQWLPEGLIYRSYLAGAKESRFASFWAHDQNLGWIWDLSLGGRAGIYRYGTDGRENGYRPQGFQIDIEGASQARLDIDVERDLVAADFRFGIPLTYCIGRHQTKVAFYHLSSHLGDEYMLKNPGFTRINYSRNVLVWGHSYYWTDDVRVYGEAGWAFQEDEATEPWEFQFGIDYSPAGPTGRRGAPFAAFNGHLRQEVDFGGNLVVQTGWQWRGDGAGHLFRAGFEYYNGKSDQFEFYNQFENKLGLAVWYDY